ncbi:SGNH/GDSL hydrolase family protein [Nannocystis sp.]|uniref:SGNH/GDSL hydrolase family protein n=1 Tax=Nannocystis sp. TaxID=1962667 RepID=UPI002424274D|nr:SGNH/GDSL hydrolase family protein [Nannocystis sp.]MBK7827625.1 acetyl xylan esterase [Nannocystis sp.]MBK9753670.1 acetyl xylan esterase [Nannocystis sp.]
MRRALILVCTLSCFHGTGEGAPSTGEGTSETGGGSTTTGTSAGSSGGVSDASGVATATPTTSGGESSGDTTVGVGESSGSTTGGEDPPPEPPAIHYVGRHDASDPGHVRMGWSGVGAVFRFNGTGASVRLDDKGRYFTVVVDGAVQATLATSPGEQSYPLAQGLPAGEHTIELYRRTEGSFGPTVLLGVDLEGELLAPPPVQRRIEIIGDSITCGYGDEGVSPCNFSAETENHYLTYGAVAARALGAELSTVAWSGKGVVNNFGDDVFEPLPTIYDRLLASDAAPWDFSWQPDAVVINLGTNDFSTGNDPPEAVFVPAYVGFLEHLRSVYPDAFILAIAPTLFGAEAQMVAGYLQSAVDQRHAAGDAAVAFADVNVEWIGSGCDGHPTVATHAAMGAKLAATLQAQLGW